MSANSPILISGCPRSGTSWVHFLIAAHPATGTVRETHLYDKYIGPLKEWFAGEDAYRGRDGLSNIFDDRKFVAQILTPIVDTTFRRIAEADPDRRLVEKTPGNILHHELIAEIQPDAQLLYVVRDPRAVVASFKAAAAESWGSWARKPVADVCTSWNRYNIAYVAARETWSTARLMAVRFEDMKTDGPGLLSRIHEWAGLETNDEIIEKSLESNKIDKLQKIDEDELRADTRRGFYRKGAIYSWVEELELPEIRQIEAACADFMKFWGYERYRPKG